MIRLQKLTMLLLFPLTSIFGVVSGDVQVTGVISGHAVFVKGEIGGQPVKIPVRLLYVIAPEPGVVADDEAIKKARDTFSKVVGHGNLFRLWAPGDTWTYDEYGRLLAVIYPSSYYEEGKVSPELSEIAIPLNANAVASGNARLTDRYGAIPDLSGLKQTLLDLEEIARKTKSGFWKDQPEWFIPTNEKK